MRPTADKRQSRTAAFPRVLERDPLFWSGSGGDVLVGYSQEMSSPSLQELDKPNSRAMKPGGRFHTGAPPAPWD